jgi:hypothetical protein
MLQSETSALYMNAENRNPKSSFGCKTEKRAVCPWTIDYTRTYLKKANFLFPVLVPGMMDMLTPQYKYSLCADRSAAGQGIACV